MLRERPGCLSRILKPIADFADFFALKDEPPKTRYVKTSNGMMAELDELRPDQFAEAMSEAFKTGKVVYGYFDEETGKFILKELK